MPSITRTTDLTTLTADDLAPYRQRYLDWAATRGTDVDQAIRNWDTVAAEPATHVWHLQAFRGWLVDQNYSEPLPTVTGDRAATANALAAMRRRERDAKADAHQAHLDLVNARQALIEAQQRAAQPFDSEHPGWREFWLTAARNATRSGHCPEYDRHAELMGGITRDQFREDGESLYNREDVTVRVTLTYTLTRRVDSGEDVDLDLDEALRGARDARWDSLSYEVDEEEREEVEED